MCHILPEWRGWVNRIIIIIIYLLEFFTSALADGLSLEFEWQQVFSSLQDSSQYSRLLNNVVVWKVSTRPPTSKSSSPFSNPLVTVPNTPITISIIVTSIFHSFFFSIPKQGRGTYPSFHILSVLFYGQPGQQSPQFCKLSGVFLLLFDLVFWPRFGDPSVCQNPIGVYACHSVGQLLSCPYTIYSNGQISVSCTFPRGSPCPPSRVYSFCANLLHWLIMWLMVSSLSPQRTFAILLRLIFSRFDMIGSYGVVLCCY